MSEILAKKGNLKKTFSKNVWDLLGKEKNGWIEIYEPKQSVINEAKTPPPSGEKEAIRNIDETKQVVINEEEQRKVVDNVVSNELTIFSNFVKENLTKSQIKDYLDLENIKPDTIKFEYRNLMNLQELSYILSKKFDGNIEKLKTEFKISYL